MKTGLISGDADAMARIRATHPDMQFVPDDAFPMESAQWFSNRAVAREVGFNNWIHLTRHIAAGGALPPEGALAALVAAVERPDPDAVREMLAAHPHLAAARIWNADNPLGDTLLHRADANAPRGAPWGNRDQTTHAHIAVAQALIHHGADVNASGGAQATFLLDRGADVNARSAEGETALDIAVRLGDETFAAFLRERRRGEPRLTTGGS